MNITIILTSTVNVNNNKVYLFQRDSESRKQLYIKSVLQWLTKTNFKIILVENSGYTFDELNNEKNVYNDRFEVITFTENSLESAKYLKNNNSKGDSELFAINYAFNNSKLIESSDFIIKITGRYFIPDLQDYLLSNDLTKYDSLTQNCKDRCEMVGSSYKNFNEIFNPIITDNNYWGHIESIWKKRTSKYDNVLTCKQFSIEKTQQGGNNIMFDTI